MNVALTFNNAFLMRSLFCLKMSVLTLHFRFSHSAALPSCSHFFDIFMKSFSLLFTYSTKIMRVVAELRQQKINFYPSWNYWPRCARAINLHSSILL
jgi:hypothetical protein